ncbi:hypothetical protein D3C76_970820 [compost metagenome]
MSGKIDGVPRELLEVIANSSERTIAEINVAIQQAREILAAPVVERQPAAWTCRALKGKDGEHGSYSRIASSKDEMLNFCTHYDGIGAVVTVTPLYTSPPAPVAVALPERREPTQENPYLSDADLEWNACLDKVKELNQ